jgi:hypothetical protein
MAALNNRQEHTLQWFLDHPIDINKERKLSKQIVDVIEYNGNFYGLKSEEYINKIPLFTSNELSSIESGIYCWIIGQDKSDKYQLFFKPVFSYHEMGTKHNIIVSQAKKYKPSNSSSQVQPIVKLLFAGEFRFDGENILFNLLSGTYMYGLIDPTNVPDDIKKSIIDYFKRILGSSQINIDMDTIKTRKNKNGEIEYVSLFDKESFNNKEQILLHLLSLGVGLFKFRSMENYETHIKRLRQKNANTIKRLNNNYTKLNYNNKSRYSRRFFSSNNSNEENKTTSRTMNLKRGLFNENNNSNKGTPKKKLFSRFNNE